MAFTTFDSELRTPNPLSVQPAEAVPTSSPLGDSERSLLGESRSWWITPFVLVFLAFGMISLSGQFTQPSDEVRERLLEQGRAIALQPATTAAIAQR